MVGNDTDAMAPWNDAALASLNKQLQLNVIMAHGLDCHLETAAGGFMTRFEAQVVMSKPDNMQQMGELIKTLRGKSNRDFKIFCTMLRKTNNRVWADTLEREADRKFKEMH